MQGDLVIRVRRRVIAEIILAGGTVEPWQWRHAGLEPSGQVIASPTAPLGAGDLVGPPAGASPDGSAPREKAIQKVRHPAF